MKQLIARIDEDLHVRLKQKAADEGRSLNALVTEALERSASTAVEPHVRLERRAAERGVRLVRTRRRAGDAPDRASVIAATRGLGSFIDAKLDEDRGPRER